MSTSKRGRSTKRLNSEELMYQKALRFMRQAIVRGDFTHVPYLSEEMLEDHFRRHRIARAAIRRAMGILQTEGILEIVPKRGTRIKELREDEIRALWGRRTSLEEFVVIQLACMKNPDVTNIVGAFERMGKFVEDSEDTPISLDQQHEFVEVDQEFHSSLAVAAGYPSIASELESLRFRLHVATRLEPFRTLRRPKEIHLEHQQLLEALEVWPTKKNVRYRPSVNDVKHAFRVHMRNSAIKSWKISHLLREHQQEYNQNQMLDVPDLLTQPISPQQSFNLVYWRFAIELYASFRLASNSSVDTSTLWRIHSEMTSIAGKFNDDETIPEDEQIQFDNLDLSFHSALGYCAGLMFAEEAMTFLFKRLREQYCRTLTGKEARVIVSEHYAILTSLVGQSSMHRSNEATEATERHLKEAFLRKNFDAETLLPFIKQQIAQLQEIHAKFESRIDASNRAI